MKHYLSCLLTLVLLSMTISLAGIKSKVIRHGDIRQTRQHPYAHLLGNADVSKRPYPKAAIFNKLLVILVDFQEEVIDNPLTTGNGKFLLNEDPAYLTTIGSPPHNREYFAANLDALKYYYLAASQGSFNLQYDIYPQNQNAYTLSREMVYYNPVGASVTTFLERIQIYFKEAFELADSLDPQIDFSQYGHFMIIHAGSDWQHDFHSDTPGDLPSLFMTVRDGFEAVVDNGAVLVNHACNVPSTISQDFDSYESGNKTYYTGYGALNGVFAHEFGHSLGMVDLYSTYSFRPTVGQFDIMDSGGSGVIEDPENPGVLLEGILPALPGAFSRMIMFGDTFKQRGLYIELNQMISNLTLSDYHAISASSQKQPYLNPVPSLVRIPLNDHEYLLIENRSVDPDNDGGTALKAALNGRVALHPTAFADPLDNPTYEYDYLLPSFIDSNYNVHGGGLLVWHIDEEVLYKQGRTNNDGVFITNFENNTVNLSTSRRGVKIIEADGLNDLGNEYSWYWTGTPYEYFHKYKPNLNHSGIFVNWSTTIWRPTLNSASVPPLFDDQHQPAFYGLSEISQPASVMTFRLSAGIFNDIYVLGSPDSLQTPLPVINSDIIDNVLPVWRNGSLHFYMYEPSLGLNKWTELIDPLQLSPADIIYEPIVADLDNNNLRELVIPFPNNIVKIDFNSDYPQYELLQYKFASSPLSAFGKLFICVSDSVKALHNNSKNSNPNIILLSGDKIAASDVEVIVLNQDRLQFIDHQSGLITYEIILPELCTLFEPVIVKNADTGDYLYLIMSDAGNIYSCVNNVVKRIFSNPISSLATTNMAVCKIENYSPCIVFAAQNRLFAINKDGTLLPGYPKYFENYTFKPYTHIRTLSSTNDPVSSNNDILMISTDKGGLLAVNADGQIDNRYSIINMNGASGDIFYQIFRESKLHWFFIDSEDNLIVAEIWNKPDQYFHWSGFRNSANGLVILEFSQPEALQTKIGAYILPNPVKTGLATLRVENPSDKLSVYIYDVSGKLLYKERCITNNVRYKDIQIDVSKFSSGVYLAVVDCNNQIKRTKFAVER